MQVEDIKISEVSRQRIVSFQNRFTPIYGEGHFIFACHAAFPVIFTPDMLHRIWLNFNMYPGSNGDEAISGHIPHGVVFINRSVFPK